MKKFLCALFAVVALACYIPSFTLASDVVISDSAPIIYAEDTTVNAVSSVIELPEPYVYDAIDVGIVPDVAVSKNGVEYTVRNGRFIADDEGEYTVTYSATNSCGVKAEKTILLKIVDDEAPVIEAYSDSFVILQGVESKLPFFVKDFYPVDIEVYYKDVSGTKLLEETFVFEKTVKNAKIEIKATERRENGLSASREFSLNVVNKGFIYGFDDIGASDAVYWTKAQSGQNIDPEKYQVPSVEQNIDEKYVHDADGKSFKVTVKGKEGMNSGNSWPRIDCYELNTFNAKNYDYIVAWIYNDSPDFEELGVFMQLDMSNAASVKINAKRGEWTKIRIGLDEYNGKKGNKTLGNVQFFVNGFEDGTATYYVDDLYFE